MFTCNISMFNKESSYRSRYFLWFYGFFHCFQYLSYTATELSSGRGFAPFVYETQRSIKYANLYWRWGNTRRRSTDNVLVNMEIIYLFCVNTLENMGSVISRLITKHLYFKIIYWYVCFSSDLKVYDDAVLQ